MLPPPVSRGQWVASGNLAFGARREDGHIHQGVDFPAPKGTPVWSVSDGVVELVAEPGTLGVRGYGRAVVVRLRDGVRALYGHLSAASVSPGEAVLEGQQLGEVGETCDTRDNINARCKTGPHVHFELANGPYSPNRAPVRLDPLRYTMSDNAEDTGWQVLAQLYGELWEAIPEEYRDRPELVAKRDLWAQAFEESQSGFGLADSALRWWVDEYNADRRKLIQLGLTDVPPAANPRPEWHENLATAAREGVVAPAKAAAAGFAGGAVLVLLALAFWGRK